MAAERGSAQTRARYLRRSEVVSGSSDNLEDRELTPSKISTFSFVEICFSLCVKNWDYIGDPDGSCGQYYYWADKFEGDEDARKFFYLYENVVTKSLPDCARAEKIVAYLSGAAFDFYFDRFTLDNALTEETKEYG